MQKVEPKVYCIAETRFNDSYLHEWLYENQWSECLSRLSGTEAERLIELAARSCYRSFKVGGENSNPNITKVRGDSKEYIGNILKQLHGSVLEHSSSTWAFENVSRIMTHEAVRHRSGTAMSQESGRYIRIDKLNYWIPPEIEANPEAKSLYEETMQYLEDKQKELAQIYDIDNIKDFSTKKKLTSAFRRIAPEGMGTGIIMTFNMRALRWVIENRTSEHAETEIRLVFNKVAEIATKRWPYIFQDFKNVDTNDGLFHWIPENHKV